MSQEELLKCRRDSDSKMKQLIEQFKRDMCVVDAEVGHEKQRLQS